MQYENIVCPKCGNKEMVKQGFQYRAGGQRQQYRCKGCFKLFTPYTKEEIAQSTQSQEIVGNIPETDPLPHTQSGSMRTETTTSCAEPVRNDLHPNSGKVAPELFDGLCAWCIKSKTPMPLDEAKRYCSQNRKPTLPGDILMVDKDRLLRGMNDARKGGR